MKAKMTISQAVSCGDLMTPICSSAHVRRRNKKVANQRLRRDLGNNLAGLDKFAAHSLRAPKGHITHHSRPTRIKVKMIPGHQRIHVSLVARFLAPS